MRRNDSQRHLDLRSCPELEAMGYEQALARALREVITELFFTNAGSLIAFIDGGKSAHIEDIVASSAERSLRPGALRYGGHAATHSDWGRAPQVDIHLEFHHAGLSVYFQLSFDAVAVGISIASIVFPHAVAAPAERLTRLEAALGDARQLDA